MFGKLFGRKKKEESPYDHLPLPTVANWSVLGTDMHGHFLPGIDDGAKTPEDSLAMLRTMADMGYKTVIATPHIFIDYYPNTRQTITDALAVAQNTLKENNIDLTLRAAAEYYMDDHFNHLLETEPLLTIHDKEVLVEFSMMFEPPGIAQTIFNMRTAGYKPIIAHPERYLFFHKNMDKFSELKDRGCMLQLNLLSMTGYYGQGVKVAAEYMLAKGMYDYCGTDAHHERHLNALRALGCSRDYHRLAAYPFRNASLSL